MKISDEEYQKIVMKSEAEYDRLKDTVHDYYDKIQEQEKEIERLMSLWEIDRQSWNELMAEEEFKIERLNNIINESAEEILKELEENHHLSYGVALAIRQKLLDYQELKGSDKK